MSYTFRAATAEELPQLANLVGYAFAEAEEDQDYDWVQPEWTYCAFEDDKLVASSGATPFKMRWHGNAIAMAGVTLVAANPGYRGQGLVRRLMVDAIHQAHESGVSVAMLWASMAAIYQRFGYGLAGHQVRYRIEPRHVRFQHSFARTGVTRLLPRDDALPLIDALYRQYCAPRAVLIHRNPVLWAQRWPEKDTKNPTYCAVHFENDEPVAYALYRTDYPQPSDFGVHQRLLVPELVSTTLEGYVGLWRYLASHDLVGEIHCHKVASDDPAPLMLEEPRELNKQTFDGPWLRLVDAPAAIAARGYQTSGECVVRIREDELCPWNVGAYALTVDDGTADIAPTKRSADLTVTPNGLASIVAGAATVSDVVRAGRAEAEDLPRLDALFTGRYAPQCLNDF